MRPGLINQSAQPKIAPGCCWKWGIPSPAEGAEQEGISSAPAGCQPCAETALGCWGDLSSDTFIWKNYCACLQTSPQPLSQEFPVIRMRRIMEPVRVGRAALCCCVVDVWGSPQPSDHERSLKASHSWLWMESWREPPGFVVSRVSW